MYPLALCRKYYRNPSKILIWNETLGKYYTNPSKILIWMESMIEAAGFYAAYEPDLEELS